MDDGILLLLTVLLVFLNGFFSALVFALLRARGARIKELAESGKHSAKLASAALKQLDVSLATVQIGLTLTSLALGWVSGPFLARLLLPAFSTAGVAADAAWIPSCALAFLLLACVTLVFGALSPRIVALRDADGTLLVLARPLTIFNWLLRPFSLLLSGAAAVVAGKHQERNGGSDDTQEELRLIISSGGAENGGTLRETQAELLDNVIDFGRRLARQVMTHRTEILALDAEEPLTENVRLAQEGGRTRYPLVQGDIDTVVGFVHTKDLFALYQREPDGDIRSVAREVLIVPDTIRGDQVLRQMQRKRQHMAMLVDEYGGTSGLVTITDLLEELVGEWPDEFEPQEEEWLVQLDENSWRVDGRLPLADLEEAAGRELSCDEPCDTVGGFAFWLFGRIPGAGDSVEADGVALRVAEMDGRRVSHVEVTFFGPSDEAAMEKGAVNL
ncbi:MAG: hemolysin family protein [Armatimonadota bacterium]